MLEELCANEIDREDQKIVTENDSEKIFLLVRNFTEAETIKFMRNFCCWAALVCHKKKRSKVGEERDHLKKLKSWYNLCVENDERTRDKSTIDIPS